MILDYEQRYKEALDNAKVVYKTIRKDLKPVIEQIFPELKESEDEKIRKQIISFLKEFEHDHYRSLDFSSWIAWLEKQGNNANKVEPQFHEGDWVIGANNVFKIISLNDELNCYTVVTLNNEEVKIPYYFDDGQGHMCSYHLWTIQDAKDGDVLCVKYGNNEMPFIFTGKQDDVAYCALNSFGEFVLSMVDWLLKTSVLPATKEQRDKLEKAMLKAGYKWNKEEHKLEKI